jgi:undecaprenyl diphosphate synthase
LETNLAIAENKMDLLNAIDTTNLPQHLAIIMDGNGRWAKQQGYMRAFGHENGTKSVKTTIETCAKIGIPYPNEIANQFIKKGTSYTSKKQHPT